MIKQEVPQLWSSLIKPEASYQSLSGWMRSMQDPAGSKTTPEACTGGFSRGSSSGIHWGLHWDQSPHVCPLYRQIHCE